MDKIDLILSPWYFIVMIILMIIITPIVCYTVTENFVRAKRAGLIKGSYYTIKDLPMQGMFKFIRIPFPYLEAEFKTQKGQVYEYDCGFLDELTKVPAGDVMAELL